MLWLAKWLSVPVLVIAAAACLAWANWFEHGWVIAGYTVAAFLTLFIWRRATYRLVPSFHGAEYKDLDSSLKKKASIIAISMIFGSLIVSALALFVIVFWFSSWSPSGFTLVVTILFVEQFSKFGIMNILIRRMLDRNGASAGV